MYIKKLIYLGLFIYLPLTSCSQKNNTTSHIAENNKHAIPQEKVISNPANNSGWLINYEDVYNQSIEQNKPIMANFTGSDWCGWCKKLKKAVFDTETFKKWAEQNVILFELDYPRRTPQDSDIKQQNANLQRTFGQLVRGFPTVLIFDIERVLKEDGSKSQDNIKIIGQRMGYMADPVSFINVAETNLKNRQK
jgi:protein disulfide-isomerase